MRKSVLIGLALMVAALGVLTQAVAQTTTKATVIKIEDLDCPTCAKNVEKALVAVPGVAEVKTDVETETATVTSAVEKALSPRALWEAVEKAGFKPLKLEGPNGTFTTKPAS